MAASCELKVSSGLCDVIAKGRCALCGRAFCNTHQARNEFNYSWVDMCSQCLHKAQSDAGPSRQWWGSIRGYLSQPKQEVLEVWDTGLTEWGNTTVRPSTIHITAHGTLGVNGSYYLAEWKEMSDANLRKIGPSIAGVRKRYGLSE